MISFVYFQLSRKFLYKFTKNRVRRTVYGRKIEREGAGERICELLKAPEPCMIGRIGSVEMQAINAVYNVKFKLQKEVPAVKVNTLYNNAGFFPKTQEAVQKFTQVYEQACGQLDLAAVLGSRDEDYFYKKHAPQIPIVRLTALEPYYSAKPWSRALEGRKVLVISPFAQTIESQYTKREKLFKNPDTLPAFELQTLKAVQTIGDSTEGFHDWFEALDYMKKQIAQKDFEIAILGCGAYAFPLAAYCKELGKKTIVMGGATQCLFGISGSRWDKHSFISKLYNEYWTRPSETERPKDFQSVEGGCYW